MRDGLSSTSRWTTRQQRPRAGLYVPTRGQGLVPWRGIGGGEELAPTTLRAGGERVSDKHDREWCYREGNDR